MRNNEIALRNRGLIQDEELRYYETFDDDRLLLLMQSPEAYTRTAAAKLLGERLGCTEDLVNLLLQQLCFETCLYTRLEIGNVLERGNSQTARAMTEYLGVIGKNQYRLVPEEPSKKKSYPLPRDLIARMLGKMTPEINPVLREVLHEGKRQKVLEAVDAIGFLTFYHNELATKAQEAFVIDYMESHKEDELLYWKLITCLSGFRGEKSYHYLNEICINRPGTIFEKEAKRSMNYNKTHHFGIY